MAKPIKANFTIGLQKTMDIEPSELLRLQILNHYENQAYSQGYKIIAGVDEAGRGPLAGPVVAAACIIPPGIYFPGIDDSKKLSAKSRAELFEQLKNDSRVHYGIGIVSSDVIDAINIYQAAIQAMLEAVENLSLKPDYLLVDGVWLTTSPIPNQRIIKGDAQSQSIAAASIIAKETRDSIMRTFDETWPHYGFSQNKGYGTACHLEALKKHGPCPIHRFSFAPVIGEKIS